MFLGQAYAGHKRWCPTGTWEWGYSCMGNLLWGNLKPEKRRHSPRSVCRRNK
jgi:hypothetical protein